MTGDTNATVRNLETWLDETGDGVHWSLDPPSDLNANLVRLEPGHDIGEHVNRDVDVAIVVLEGAGRLRCDGAVHELAPAVVAHVPKGSRRHIEALDDGLWYLTVHRRRTLDIASLRGPSQP